MASSIFLIPVDLDLFEETVISPISDEEIGIDHSSPVRIWGVRNSKLNKKFYQKIREGDLLLFYNQGDYISVGTAGRKFVDKKVPKKYWNRLDADLLFEINQFSEIQVPSSDINQLLGYKPNYRPQSIRRVSNSSRRELLTEFESVSDFKEYLEDY